MNQKNSECYYFNEELKETIANNLRIFSRQNSVQTATRKAAVAVVVVNVGLNSSVYDMGNSHSMEAALILTRRSERLKKHAGQWALPGGSVDTGESAEETAIRELREEIGIQIEGSEVLGMLDDFTTRSGFTITPVVLWGPQDPEFILNHREVSSVHTIPLREFQRQDAPILHTIPESESPVLLMPVGEGWIATPTGAILYQFREVALNGLETRVSHFEQPYFAWK